MLMTIKEQTLQMNDQVCALELYDVPGDEKFMVLNRMYLRDTEAALILYDVTDKQSLVKAEQWIKELKEFAPSETVLSLAGSKIDYAGAHNVSSQDGQNFARKHGIPVCMEVSAKSSKNVDALFHQIAVQCYESRDKFVSNPPPLHLP